jgi:endogenous inhibitor of DNA gyrase (YacG/DUF329 family)
MPLPSNAAPAPRPAVPFCCLRCKTTLGMTTDAQIDVGWSVIKSRAVLTCPVCHKRRSWRPTNNLPNPS